MMRLRLPLEHENYIESIKVGILWSEMYLHPDKGLPAVAELYCFPFSHHDVVVIRRLRAFRDTKERLGFMQTFMKPMNILGFPVDRDGEVPYLVIQKKDKEAISVFSADNLPHGDTGETGDMTAKIQAGIYLNIEAMEIKGWSSDMFHRISGDSIAGFAEDFFFSLVELLGKFNIQVEAVICSQEAESSGT